MPQLLKNKEPNGAWTTAAPTSLMLISSANCFLKGEFWPPRDSRCLAQGCALYIYLLCSIHLFGSVIVQVSQLHTTHASSQRILDSVSHDWYRNYLGTGLGVSLLSPLLLLCGIYLRATSLFYQGWTRLLLVCLKDLGDTDSLRLATHPVRQESGSSGSCFISG